MKAALPFATLFVLALAGCDNPKPRPTAAPPPNLAAPTVKVAPPASAGLPKRAEMAVISLDLINDAQDPLNRPAAIKAGVPVTFSGFGFDPVAKAAGKGLDIVVDGVAYGTTYGHERQDVAGYFETEAVIKTGFTATLPASVNTPGPHKAIIRVVAADGAAYFDSVTYDYVAK